MGWAMPGRATPKTLYSSGELNLDTEAYGVICSSHSSKANAQYFSKLEKKYSYCYALKENVLISLTVNMTSSLSWSRSCLCRCFRGLWFLWVSCSIFLPPATPRSTSAPPRLIDGDFWRHGEMWIPAGLPATSASAQVWAVTRTNAGRDGRVVGGSRAGLSTGCVLNNFDRGVWTVSQGWS